jgi:hypothetical protein
MKDFYSINVNGSQTEFDVLANDTGTGVTIESINTSGAAGTATLKKEFSLYVAGGFTEAGGTSVSGIAKWDGTTWSALGTSGLSVANVSAS